MYVFWGCTCVQGVGDLGEFLYCGDWYGLFHVVLCVLLIVCMFAVLCFVAACFLGVPSIQVFCSDYYLQYVHSVISVFHLVDGHCCLRQ